MVQLTAKLDAKNQQLLGRALTQRIQKIETAEVAARASAAATATRATRSSFHYLRPANAPSRRGRPSTQGKFASYLEWKATQDGVAFDTAEADRRIPYWIILEIGTGHRAVVRQGGVKLPQGRPAKGNNYVRTVKSQRGREIPATLAFGTGPRGRFTPPGASRGQQLYMRRQLKGAPLLPRGPRSGLFITKEIEAQHFVQKGGVEGFREYQTKVLSAARRAFAGKGRP